LHSNTFITVALLLFSSVSIADDLPAWLYKAIKVNNPNELAYFINLDEDCPLNNDELTKITEGVFIRSRIKPLKNDIFVKGRIYLSVELQCVKTNNGSQVFAIATNFARYTPKPPVIFDYPFTFTGIGPKDYIEQNLKNSTERAITAFIKANFDL